MDSPFGLSLATLLAHYEQIWQYWRYICSVSISSSSWKINEYLNTKHANIKFTNETEVNASLPFLDVLISWNKFFTTTVYHKPTYSGIYSNFNSFVADEYKHGLIFALLFQIFSIVSDFHKVSWKSKLFKCIREKFFFYYFSW